MMDFKALNIPIDPVYKQSNIEILIDQSKMIMVKPSLKLNLIDVIFNQAKYLNHFSYLVYIIAFVVLMMMVKSVTSVEIVIYLGALAVIFPLLTILECSDASRHGLDQLQATYPFNTSMVMTIRFTYLTIINTVVLSVYMILIALMAVKPLLDMVSAISLLASLWIYSGSSLYIGLTIKNQWYALLINLLINGICQLIMIPLLFMVIDSGIIVGIAWCLLMGCLSALVIYFALKQIKTKGFVYGWFDH